MKRTVLSTASEREVDVVEIAGRTLGQRRREADGRLRGEAEIAGGVRQLAHLLGGRLDDALVTIAGIDAPQASEAVDQLMAGGIGDDGALGRCQDARAGGLVAAIGRNRMHQMGAVEFDERVAEHDDLRFSRTPGWPMQRMSEAGACCRSRQDGA
jgi:hypothetical protein